jgi:hypothetical protein
MECLLLPVAFSSDSYKVSEKIGKLNFLRLIGEAPEEYAQRLTAKLTHELCRLLIDPKATWRADQRQGVSMKPQVSIESASRVGVVLRPST